MEHQNPPYSEQGDRVRARDHGIRRVRRLSNWTALALVAATGATAGYFAQASHSAAASASQPAAAAAHGSGQPCVTAPVVTAPVATTGGSGVAAAPAPVQACGSGATANSPAISYPAAGDRERD